VKKFLSAHAQKITGVLSCFDRLLFKGFLPISHAQGMEKFFFNNHWRIKDFKVFLPRYSNLLVQHAKDVAQKANRPYHFLQHPVDKEDYAKAIASKDAITSGLVCVLSAVESCSSFKITFGQNRPCLRNARRKCLCLYFYLIDPVWGWMHVRVESWFPFHIQVCLNGHEALALAMQRQGLSFEKLDNAFVSLSDPGAAQRLADELTQRDWPFILSCLARRFNPLLRTLLRGMNYYWTTQQAEYSTDILFRSRAELQPLYQKLVQHATLAFSAEDVMTFLGRKLTGHFAGQIVNDLKKRWPGVRVKHRVKENWIKMYDKFGVVLRIETVINNPYDFKVRRKAWRKGRRVWAWCPLSKGVGYLWRYAQIAGAANRRYLAALAIVADPAPAAAELHNLASPVIDNGRSYRGFNPASADEARVCRALLRGEHALQGFRNQHIRGQLFAPPRDPAEQRHQAASIGRLLKRLHMHGLLAKIPRTRRWRLTDKGFRLLSMIKVFHDETLPHLLQRKADAA